MLLTAAQLGALQQLQEMLRGPGVAVRGVEHTRAAAIPRNAPRAVIGPSRARGYYPQHCSGRGRCLLLTFVRLEVGEDVVDGGHGLVHQLVQLRAARPRLGLRVQQQQVGRAVLPLLQQPAAPPRGRTGCRGRVITILATRPPRRPRAEAGLPVRGAEAEEVVYTRLHAVPLLQQPIRDEPEVT